MFKEIFKNVRESAPLIHNITNYVTVNDVANMLIACGAAPIMADESKEVREITSICSGLNINIGTLNERTIVSMCIATATDKYLIEAALKRCNIEKYFKEIFTCGEVGESKYSPKIYREALKFLNGKRMDTLVFEDAVYAASTAKEDGFKVVSVYDKSEEKQELLKGISDFYLKDFLSIGSLLRQMEE